MKKKVALCLASGGARGMAHIGAIEELLERGYEITSLSGCSIGSLIGGIYAAGKIKEARDWFCALDKKDVLQLTDFSFGLSHMVKGVRVMDAIKEWVPDTQIENLPIPCAFVATDLNNSREVVFTKGPLFEAIRASISIPLCFEPVKHNGSLLVDGGLCNPFPLNRVARLEDDILVGVNISGTSVMNTTAEVELKLPSKLQQYEWARKAEEVVAETIENTLSMSVGAVSMLNRMVDLQIQANCRLLTEMCKPDVYVEMAQDAYTTFDFDKAEQIMDAGREMMAKALDAYEK